MNIETIASRSNSPHVRHLLTELECLYELKQIWISAGGRVDSVINSQISGAKHEC